MLKAITLAHFQKHAHFSHQFGPGLTVCVGPNWSGKSTLLRAILYALFGTSGVNITAKHLATRGEKKPTVDLDFAVGGLDYHLSRSPDRCELWQGTELIATGTTGVTAKVEALIGPAKSFLHYQVARQGEAGHLLTLGSGKLAQHINAVTGIDLVDQVLALIRDEKLSGKGALLGGEHVRDDWAAQQRKLADLTKSYAERKQAEVALAQGQQELQAALPDIYAAYVKASAAHSAWQNWQEAEAERQQTLTEATRQITTAQEALAELPPIEGEGEALDALLALQQRHQTRTDLLRRQVDTDKRLRQAQYELEKLPQSAAAADMTALIAELREAEAEHRTLYADLLAKQAELNQASCPTCKRPFGTCDEPAVQQEIDRLRAALEPATRRRQASTTAMERAERSSRQSTTRAAWETELAHYTTQLMDIATAMTAVADATDEALEAARQQHQRRQQQAAMRQVLQQTLTAAQAEVDRHRHPAPEVPRATQGEVDAALQAYQAAYQTYQEGEQALTAVRAELAHWGPALVDTRKRVEELVQQVAELDRLEQRQRRLTALGKYLTDNRDRFMQSAWDSLLNYASAFIQSASNGALQSLRRDAKGEFLYVEDGVEMPLELASGMQQAILGVAVKLALAAAIGSNFDVLLLDEVSAAASDENALRLAECLAATGQQVFLISHRPADAVVAQSVIELQ